jgi:hypothetical protein
MPLIGTIETTFSSEKAELEADIIKQKVAAY